MLNLIKGSNWRKVESVCVFQCGLVHSLKGTSLSRLIQALGQPPSVRLTLLSSYTWSAICRHLQISNIWGTIIGLFMSLDLYSFYYSLYQNKHFIVFIVFLYTVSKNFNHKICIIPIILNSKVKKLCYKLNTYII